MAHVRRGGPLVLLGRQQLGQRRRPFFFPSSRGGPSVEAQSGGMPAQPGMGGALGVARSGPADWHAPPPTQAPTHAPSATTTPKCRTPRCLPTTTDGAPRGSSRTSTFPARQLGVARDAARTAAARRPRPPAAASAAAHPAAHFGTRPPCLASDATRDLLRTRLALLPPLPRDAVSEATLSGGGGGAKGEGAHPAVAHPAVAHLAIALNGAVLGRPPIRPAHASPHDASRACASSIPTSHDQMTASRALSPSRAACSHRRRSSTALITRAVCRTRPSCGSRPPPSPPTSPVDGRTQPPHHPASVRRVHAARLAARRVRGRRRLSSRECRPSLDISEPPPV